MSNSTLRHNLRSALSAAIEYSFDNSYPEKNEFREKPLIENSQVLPLREQHEMFLMAETTDSLRVQGYAAALNMENLLSALQDGKMIAWGFEHPHTPKSKKVRLNPSQWRYLSIDTGSGVAQGHGQAYSSLEFEILPDPTRSATSRKRGRPSRHEDILGLFDENERLLSGFSQEAVAEFIKNVAAERYGTTTGFDLTTVIKALRMTGKFKPLKTKE